MRRDRGLHAPGSPVVGALDDDCLSRDTLLFFCVVVHCGSWEWGFGFEWLL